MNNADPSLRLERDGMTRGTSALVIPFVFVLHAILFLALLWWSWRKWPDPIADFGRELYVPWQLTGGKVLYRDVASLFGPLSPYVNAFWMRLFGVSLMTIAICNAAIFAGIIAAVHYFIRVATDRFTATIASLAALALCGFCQYLDASNYNFITPYAHEATHGLALGVLTLILVHRAMAHSQPLLGVPAGLLFGFLLLTKAEVPVATIVAVAVGLAAYASAGHAARRCGAAMMIAFCAASLIGPTLFFAYFRSYVGQSQAFRNVGAAWFAAFNPAIITNPFYRTGMGIDRAGPNAASMVALFVAVLAAIAVAVALASTRAVKRSRAVGRILGIVVLLLVAAPLTQLLPLGRTFPLVTLAAFMTAGASFWTHRSNSEMAMRHLALMMWCAFAGAMLAKMILNARLAHYGFYLALPAVTVAVIGLCAIVPAMLERWQSRRSAQEFRWIAATAVAAVAAVYLGISQHFFASKQTSIGSGSDRFYLSDLSNFPTTREGLMMRDALEELAPYARRGETIAVVPEGIMLNYLLRVDSPLRVVTLMPPELLTYGEDTIVRSLQAGPPTFIVFVHKDTAEYGYPLFGTDSRYGEKTMAWVRDQYQPIKTMGNDPLSPAGEGIAIFLTRWSPRAKAQPQPAAPPQEQPKKKCGFCGRVFGIGK